jgi:RNA polymerase sigma-70 factor, ECF subfamily
MHDGLRAEVQGLLIRLADGDRSAFDPLFALVWPLLSRFTERALKGRADAQDAAQQALLKVFWRVSEFDRRQDGLSWIFGVTAFECRTARRKHQRRREEPLPGGEWMKARGDGSDGEEALIRQDLVAAAEEVLSGLAPGDVEAIRVAIRGEQRPAGLAAPAFRKRLERAFRRLRLAWSTKYGSNS